MTDLPGWVVDAGWVAAHLDDVVLADIRWYLDGRSGRTAYEAGHVPGAVFVDLDEHLSAPDKGGPAGRHPFPTPEAFAAAMGSLGIGPDTPVVAYDDSAGGGNAARLVVMLRLLGRPAALLDGGLPAWTQSLETGGGNARSTVEVPVAAWPAERLATADDVAAALAGGGVVLDARVPERYRGDVEPVDAKAGHVPGAQNLPWTSLSENGCLLPVDALQARFAALGASDGAVVYCGSGVSACVDLVAMEHAGVSGGRLFVGSWSGWSSDPERPVAVGSQP